MIRALLIALLVALVAGEGTVPKPKKALKRRLEGTAGAAGAPATADKCAAQ